MAQEEERAREQEQRRLAAEAEAEHRGVVTNLGEIVADIVELAAAEAEAMMAFADTSRHLQVRTNNPKQTRTPFGPPAYLRIGTVEGSDPPQCACAAGWVVAGDDPQRTRIDSSGLERMQEFSE